MLKGYQIDRSGGVAIEFSILLLPFFTMIFMVFAVGYHALVQAELDRATTAIAQHVAMFASPDLTSADYLANGACGDFVGPLLDCNQVRLGAEKVVGRLVDYRSTLIGPSQWSLGCAGDTVIIELTYPFTSVSITPIAIADIVKTGGGTFYRSRAVIRREPVFVSGAAC